MSVNIFGSSGDGNRSSGVDKNYVDQKFVTLSTNLITKVDKSGDTMGGDLNMGSCRVTNLNEPEDEYDAANRQYVDSKIKIVTQIANAKLDKNQEIDMGGNNISNMVDPQHDQDAATKKYVDKKRIKNNIGYVPQLTENIYNKYGFIVSASSEKGNEYQAYNVFNAFKNEWCVDGIHRDFWIKIKCPERIRIHKFSLRGVDNAKIISWSLQGSNDDEKWKDLYISKTEFIDTEFYFFNTNPPYESFMYYRFYSIISESKDPGLSHWQLYTIN